MKNAPQVKYLNYFLFALLALLWSGSFINIKIVVSAMPPVFCAMMRVLISLIFLSLFFTMMRKKILLPPSQCWRMWLAGLFTQAFPFALLFFGEKFIAPALASIINGTVSIWTLILGSLIFRDFSQWTPIKVTGIIFGTLGIVLIFYPFLHGSESSLIGILSVMGMAISYAIGGLINQHVIFKNSKIKFETNLIQQHVASVVFLIATSYTLESWPAWANLFDTKIMLAFLYLGLMATAIAWVIYFYLIKEWGAVRTVSVMYVVPMLAIVWDLLFLHIMPTQSELIGMLAILVGVILIQWVRKPHTITMSTIDSTPARMSPRN